MIELKVDVTDILKSVQGLKHGKTLFGMAAAKYLPLLGKEIRHFMILELQKHKYIGTLDASVTSEYHAEGTYVEIGPEAKRGKFWAGTIAQAGTGPVNAPWKKIRAWGQYRGLTKAQSLGALKKIRARGVAAHPFLEETLNRSDTQSSLQKTADQVADDIASGL